MKRFLFFLARIFCATAVPPHANARSLRERFRTRSDWLRHGSIAGRLLFFTAIFFSFFHFSVFLSAQSSDTNPLPEEFVSLFEKVELEELPPADEYYVDDAPVNQILKLFDEEDYENQKKFLEQMRKKIIKETGGIQIPDDSYAQGSVHDFIARYMTNFGKKNLYKILDDGEKYRLYVRAELKKRNMPAALEYLPVVESEYKATAKSRSGARGLWQFMENSMSPFLKKNEWFDERLDPWKSTQAALSKLQDNYRMFGDWTLAIGAYNCGAGAVRRALKKTGAKTFWQLSEKGAIPEETIYYVPKLLAITEIAENSAEYRVSLPVPNEAIRYEDFDFVTVDFTLPLELLETELRMAENSIKNLNTELLHEKTPPYPYPLRLPQGLKLSAEEAVEKMKIATPFHGSQ